jgi:hypothetical protein
VQRSEQLESSIQRWIRRAALLSSSVCETQDDNQNHSQRMKKSGTYEEMQESAAESYLQLEAAEATLVFARVQAEKQKLLDAIAAI